ncbi:hypothetical protein F4815DRAFT_457904 [Daldinia loculata]|nr:hypothetical protein F4815DRAFT_457904 [Daldinia loculata]
MFLFFFICSSFILLLLLFATPWIIRGRQKNILLNIKVTTVLELLSSLIKELGILPRIASSSLELVGYHRTTRALRENGNDRPIAVRLRPSEL